MLTNDQMKPNRFAKWAKARAKVAAIKAHLKADGRVVLGTCTKAWVFTAKHADMFKATKSGAYVQHGKGWDCIDFSAIKFVA